MHRLKLTILGNGSAVPTASANPTSQLLTYQGDQFMFDCGEGTQMQLIKYKVRYRKLDNIFISHLHGDHFYGLIGLISTFNLFGRIRPLNIYAPSDLELIIKQQLQITNTKLHFDLNFIHLKENVLSVLIDTETYDIKSFPLKHSIITWGFIFKEKQALRKINKDFVIKKSLNPNQILNIKQGVDFVDDNGEIFENESITSSSRLPISYAFCSDTVYDESIVEYIENVDLLYHEATFDNSMEDIAFDKLHSTASQAAKIAALANVKQLLMGHFSARFKDPTILLNEAIKIFPNTSLSKEGQTYMVGL